MDNASSKTKNTLQHNKGRIVLSPPDGGWGWIIVIGCVLARGILSGLQSSSGIFYLKFEEKFHQSSVLTLWMCTLPDVLRTILSPMSAFLINRFSCRSVSIAGTIVLGLSFALTAFVDDLIFTIFSFSLLGGVGMCLVFFPSVFIINQYFSKRRGLANALAGWTIWAFIFPTAINFLFEYYGFLGAFLMQSGVVLHIIVCGSLFRPLTIDINSNRKSQQTTNPERSIKSGQVDEECCNNTYSCRRCCSYPNIKTLMADYRFLSYSIASALCSISNQLILAFIPLFGREMGIEARDSVYVVSAQIFSVGVGRVCSGVLFDMQFLAPYKIIVYNGILLSVGITLCVLPVTASTLTEMFVLCSIHGVLMGCIQSQKHGMLVDIIDMEHMINALGILLLFQGVGSCLSPIIAGYITDISDTVSGGFYFGGLCTTGGAIIFAMANIVHWNKTKGRPKFVSDISKISGNDTVPNLDDTSCRLEGFRPMNTFMETNDFI